MKTNKKSSLEMETVIKFILAIVVLAVLVLLFTKYGGSMYNGIKNSASNVIALSNKTILIPK